ncbi:MAG: RluA family pseudouridine synthase [Dehalococcoidia bacterium]|nr:RluA family pseudouridine synthase [Dehalococcoidia bacterium]|tara:strand:+ start:4806 stop:5699 length:894 start_codon:yes stop_codon:yes gene_type:complete
METIEICVDVENIRLDQYISDRLNHISRSRATQLVRNGDVTVNGETVKPSFKVRHNQKIVIDSANPMESKMIPQDIPVNIIFQDEEIIVVDKPAGMPVHPGAGHEDGTLANALLYKCPDLRGIGDVIRPGIVHRLDMDTSGVMVVAKSEPALRIISDQFKQREVKKTYIALVKGLVDSQEAVIEAPIGRDPGNRKKMAVVSSGRESVTQYKIITRYKFYDLLEIKPFTGRTHQIRVHLSSIGHPIVGDVLYGTKVDGLARPFLHAALLSFKHPISGDIIEFRSDLHQDLETFLVQLG